MNAFPKTQHGLLYVDPPWLYEMYSAKGEEKSPQKQYGCMTLPELKAMRDDVLFSSAPDCVCVMWATFAMLPAALDLLSCWGFQYKTGGPWIKRSKKGTPAFGTGYVLRSAAELFLIGTSGQPKIKNKSTRNLLLTGTWPLAAEELDSVIVDTLRREHSRKPDEMIPLLEALFEGPYLELFARTTREGWTTWGNQTDKFTTEAA